MPQGIIPPVDVAEGVRDVVGRLVQSAKALLGIPEPHDTTVNAHEPPSLARKAKRWIFPVAVLGSSGTKTTHWGLL
jgi:hypothetical protein